MEQKEKSLAHRSTVPHPCHPFALSPSLPSFLSFCLPFFLSSPSSLSPPSLPLPAPVLSSISPQSAIPTISNSRHPYGMSACIICKSLNIRAYTSVINIYYICKIDKVYSYFIAIHNVLNVFIKNTNVYIMKKFYLFSKKQT